MRGAVLERDTDLTEDVKRNAPSSCRGGQERVTFRLRLEDPAGLLTWPAPDLCSIRR